MSLSFNGKEVNKVKFNNSDVNYVIKDGKLVWANPNLYLGFSGSQYIDTNSFPTNGTNVEGKIHNPGYNTWVYCRRTTYNSSDSFALIFNHGLYGNTNFFIVSNNSRAFAGSYLDKTLTFKVENKQLFINGNIILGTSPDNIVNSSLPLLIGSSNARERFFTGNFYYFKVYDNDILVRHFIPVPAGLKIGDYTVPSNGMWDIVSQQFFGNSGTGEFIYGKDK